MEFVCIYMKVGWMVLLWEALWVSFLDGNYSIIGIEIQYYPWRSFMFDYFDWVWMQVNEEVRSAVQPHCEGDESRLSVIVREYLHFLQERAHARELNNPCSATCETQHNELCILITLVLLWYYLPLYAPSTFSFQTPNSFVQNNEKMQNETFQQPANHWIFMYWI